MTDIVERLRREGVEFYEQAEAADEIERLRADNAAKGRWNAEWHGRLLIAQAENERLRAALEDIADYYKREFSEGEKAYQAVIVARRALEPKT